uniref:uncharacterized protein LOC122609070 n=1 Tax=Erigeron canadensis TaxID=72917 RepID=UPI001CB90403|nr:uncharacterized protein LOC122609070 [Erigeron canadensis]
MLFFMGILKKQFISDNLKALLTPQSPIMFANFTSLYMASSKPLGHGSPVSPQLYTGRLQQLQKLKITECRSLRKIFEIEGDSNDCCHSDIDKGSDIVTTPRFVNMILLELPKLKILRINQCDLLEHIFTSSTLKSLKQLEELTIEECKAMKIIVKEDGEHSTSKVVIFPLLKSLTLTDLPNVEGFFLGMNEFRWPLLDKVKIFGCSQIMVFTSGHSMTLKLNCMHTGLGRHSLECGVNFQLTNESNEDMSLLLFQELRISDCKNMEVVVKQVEEDSDTTANEVIVFPCLKSVILKLLENLKGVYLGPEAFM